MKKIKNKEAVIKKIKIEKKHVQGFIAGVIFVVILFSCIYISVNPSFLTGSMINSTEVTDGSFEKEVLKSDRPTLVYYYVYWTQPRFKKLYETVDNIAKYCSEYIKIVKLDVDSNSDAAVKYSIMTSPTLILFDDGKVVSRVTSLSSGEKLYGWLDGIQLNWSKHYGYKPWVSEKEVQTVCNIFIKNN